MRCKAIRSLVGTGVLIATCCSLAATGQTTDAGERLSVTDHRPLSEAILQLVRRHGWSVTYEDAYYENLLELQDVTWKIARPGRPAPRRQLAAYEGRLELAYSRNDGPDEVISALLAAYHQSGHGYEFRMTRSLSMVHVIPAVSTDAGGSPRPRRSRLDVPVTVAAGNRTIVEFIQAVLDDVRRVSGRTILASPAPGNANIPMTLERFEQGARNETAQDAIERALATTGDRHSWQLLCGAGVNTGCALNLFVIPRQVAVVD